MASNIQQLRDKGGETEKITLVMSIWAASICWFMNSFTPTAPTSSEQQSVISLRHADAVTQSIDRHTLELGLRDYSRADLETMKAAGEKLHVKVVGLARIAADVTPELTLATIGSITVLGALQASVAVKSALAQRIK